MIIKILHKMCLMGREGGRDREGGRSVDTIVIGYCIAGIYVYTEFRVCCMECWCRWWTLFMSHECIPEASLDLLISMHGSRHRAAYPPHAQPIISDIVAGIVGAIMCPELVRHSKS